MHSTKLRTPAKCLLRALSPRCRTVTTQPYRPFGCSPPPDSREPRQAQMVPVMQKKLAGFVLNGDIETRWVQTKTEDGKLSPPQMLETLLRRIDQSAHAVRQLSATGPSPDTSIVEVVAIQDLMKVATEKEKATREIEKQKKDQRPKQMEVNWAISENDLGLKLKQMEQFLEKGKKVEIMLAAKKRQRKATPEEGEAVLKKLRKKIDEIGAKEVSKMQGKLLGQAILSVKKDG